MDRLGPKTVVLLSVVSATLAVAALREALPRLRAAWRSTGPAPAVREGASEVVLWVGDLAPGVRGVLSAVWNEPGPDQGHDEELNRGLGLAGDDGLAYYRLVARNASDASVTLRLRDGMLAITPASGSALPMRSLAAILAPGDGPAPPSPSIASTLSALGAARETLELLPGRMASLIVAFSRRVDLSTASSVASAEGGAFQSRRISRRRWDDMLGSPRDLGWDRL